MIPFIDLKSQYQRLEGRMQERFNRVMAHGQYIMGPEIQELETLLASYVGTKHCIALSSGTDALLLALMALDIKPGDEVIVPDFSFFGTAEVVELLRAKCVFAEVDPRTANLDPKTLAGLITPKTRAIMPVGLYGQCAEMDEINTIARNHSLPVIEDAAQSFGAMYKGRKSCALAEIGCTSFFPSKPLGCYGDGGACFTDRDDLAQTMRELRVHGQAKRYYHTRIGVNARMDTLQAAFLVEKMSIFEEEVGLRQEVADRYNSALKGVVETPLVQTYNRSVWAQYTIQVDQREAVIARLQELGVPTAVHYPLELSQQPVFSPERRAEARNPIAARLAKRVLSLPMHPYLSAADQAKVVEAVKRAVAQ